MQQRHKLTEFYLICTIRPYFGKGGKLFAEPALVDFPVNVIHACSHGSLSKEQFPIDNSTKKFSKQLPQTYTHTL